MKPRSSLIHFACIWVAPPRLATQQAFGLRRDKSSGGNTNAGKMDQTWSRWSLSWQAALSGGEWNSVQARWDRLTQLEIQVVASSNTVPIWSLSTLSIMVLIYPADNSNAIPVQFNKKIILMQKWNHNSIIEKHEFTLQLNNVPIGLLVIRFVGLLTITFCFGFSYMLYSMCEHQVEVTVQLSTLSPIAFTST